MAWIKSKRSIFVTYMYTEKYVDIIAPIIANLGS